MQCLKLLFKSLPTTLSVIVIITGMSSNATDTTYIINREEDDVTDGSEPVTDDAGPVDTYLDERINIPDADNVRIHDCVLEFFNF